jgi:hypothetical protein
MTLLPILMKQLRICAYVLDLSEFEYERCIGGEAALYVYRNLKASSILSCPYDRC